MLGIIGCIIANFEHSIHAKLLPSQCKRCGTTLTEYFERLSIKFDTIPPLLAIEVGHLAEQTTELLLCDINREFTIGQEERLLRYKLAGLSIFLGNHFYSLINIEGRFYRFDSISETPIELHPCNYFMGKANTIFYAPHSAE